MKVEIKYYALLHNAHENSPPTYDQSEFLTADNWDEIDVYINKKFDLEGNKYKKERFGGFDYISKKGAIIIKKL